MPGSSSGPQHSKSRRWDQSAAAPNQVPSDHRKVTGMLNRVVNLGSRGGHFQGSMKAVSRADVLKAIDPVIRRETMAAVKLLRMPAACRIGSGAPQLADRRGHP